jgi:hypothetical protein
MTDELAMQAKWGETNYTILYTTTIKDPKIRHVAQISACQIRQYWNDPRARNSKGEYSSGYQKWCSDYMIMIPIKKNLKGKGIHMFSFSFRKYNEIYLIGKQVF